MCQITRLIFLLRDQIFCYFCKKKHGGNCTLLCSYAASSGNSLPTFRDYLSVPFSSVQNPRRKPFTLVRSLYREWCGCGDGTHRLSRIFGKELTTICWVIALKNASLKSLKNFTFVHSGCICFISHTYSLIIERRLAILITFSPYLLSPKFNTALI